MGKSQSKTTGDMTDKGGQQSRGATKKTKKLPEVEEIFVQKIAYKCGVSQDELEAKKETYLQHVDTDPTLGFDEFKCLYRDLSGQQEDIFMIQYVEAIFRAFDANKDDLLTFQEWQVGFYLLLLLPQDENYGNISKEDFQLALEIIYRLYDQDGNKLVTAIEIGKISRLLQDPVVAKRLSGGVHQFAKQVDQIDMKRFAGGLSQDEFLKYFSTYL